MQSYHQRILSSDQQSYIYKQSNIKCSYVSYKRWFLKSWGEKKKKMHGIELKIFAFLKFLLWTGISINEYYFFFFFSKNKKIYELFVYSPIQLNRLLQIKYNFFIIPINTLFFKKRANIHQCQKNLNIIMN